MANHESGGLHQCLEEASIANREKGWKIRDVLIGVPEEADFKAGKIPVQIYSEPEVVEEMAAS